VCPSNSFLELPDEVFQLAIPEVATIKDATDEAREKLSRMRYEIED